jgi:rod shape determining protein RodA
VAMGWSALARADELALGNGEFLRRQIFFSILAVFVAAAVALPNYRVLCRLSYVLFALGIVALIAVYFFPVVNFAHRWMRIGPIGLQPSEFVKIAFVLAMARYLMYRENYRRLRGLIAPLAIAMLPVLLILKEPDLGMALVFLPVLFAMLFAAGARRQDLAGVAVAGLLMLPVLWLQMSDDQKMRVVSLFEQPSPGQQVSKEAYQLYQAKQVRAMGGVWGSFWTGRPTDDAAV